MSNQELKDEIENLTLELGRTKSLALCCEQAIFKSLYDTSEYEGSLYILTRLIHDLHIRMRELSDKIWSNETDYN